VPPTTTLYSDRLVLDRLRARKATGETLERVYPDRRKELAVVLGRHFHQAGDHARARQYFALRGDTPAF